LARQKTLQFGQVKVDRRRVWHSDNRTEGKIFTSPAALRAFLRDDPFRPLATSADLPAGWQVPLDAPEQAHAVLETLYPGLIADWAASKRGALKTDALKAIGKRQNGLFQDIHRLPVIVIKMALDKVCGGCVRRPTWWPEADPAGSTKAFLWSGLTRAGALTSIKPSLGSHPSSPTGRTLTTRSRGSSGRRMDSDTLWVDRFP